MPGKAPIPKELHDKVRDALRRSFSLRDRALLLTGLNTGFRCHELAALTVGHVTDTNGVRSHVTLERVHLKGGRGRRRRYITSRTLPLNVEVSAALHEYLFSRFGGGPVKPTQPLFPSRKHGLALGRWQMGQLVKSVLRAAGDERSWRYGTHTWRKHFCRAVYEQTDHDINLTRAIMGHQSVKTTQLYLPIEAEQIDSAVLALSQPPEADAQQSFTAAAPACR